MITVPRANASAAGPAIACVVVGRDEDALALAEAVRWREALRALLSVLYALPAPVCAVSPLGDVWCEDHVAVVAAAGEWLERHAAGPGVAERVIIPGPAGASVGDWIARHDPLLVLAARRTGGLRRLVGGDASSSLPRNVACAIQVVRSPAITSELVTRRKP